MTRLGVLVVLAVFGIAPMAFADDVLDCVKKTGDTAIAARTRIIKSGKYQDERLAPIHGLRGDARKAKDDIDGAIADYSRALELDPWYQYALFARGMTRHAKGHFDEAIADYSRIVAINPKDARGFEMRGLAKARKGDHDGAIADFGRALELDPRKASLYRARALSGVSKGDLDAAMDDFNRAIGLDPKDVHSYQGRGTVRQAKGDLDRAIADYNRALDLSPGREILRVILYRRGIAKLDKGDLDGAIADASRLLEDNPENVRACIFRRYVKHLKGDADGATADYNRALMIRPDIMTAHHNRGWVWYHQGDITRATADFARAHDLDPGVYTALALHIARMREGSEARKELMAVSAGPDGKTWPAPLVDLYLGKITLAEVTRAAEHSDRRTRKARFCESSFYVGEWHLLKGERPQALAALRLVRDQCPKSSRGYPDAIHELKRLGER